MLNDLVRFNPRGQVANYTICSSSAPQPKTDEEAQRTAREGRGAADCCSYTFKGDLQGISVQAQEPPPGLTAQQPSARGHSGHRKSVGQASTPTRRKARSRIDTKNAAITMPGAFDDPRLHLRFAQGRARLDRRRCARARRTAPAFTVQLESLRVKNADAEGEATADYWNQGHGRGSLDLKAKVAHLKVTRLVRYLPTSLSERVRVYLGHALQAGIVAQRRRSKCTAI